MALEQLLNNPDSIYQFIDTKNTEKNYLLDPNTIFSHTDIDTVITELKKPNAVGGEISYLTFASNMSLLFPDKKDAFMRASAINLSTVSDTFNKEKLLKLWTLSDMRIASPIKTLFPDKARNWNMTLREQVFIKRNLDKTSDLAIADLAKLKIAFPSIIDYFLTESHWNTVQTYLDSQGNNTRNENSIFSFADTVSAGKILFPDRIHPSDITENTFNIMNQFITLNKNQFYKEHAKGNKKSRLWYWENAGLMAIQIGILSSPQVRVDDQGISIQLKITRENPQSMLPTFRTF